MQEHHENITLSLLSKPLGKSADRGLLAQSAQDAFLASADGLLLVEEKITNSLSSDAPILTDISKYLLTLGGKRIRPLLSVLTAKLFCINSANAELISAAAGIELIHMATLLHDDIIDCSSIRRGNPSAYVKFGASQTLLAGDFLLVKAFGLCAQLDRFVIESTEQACIALTEGEILEEKLSGKSEISLETYINVIKKKTASLFSLACAVGAHLSGVSETDTKTLFQFGELSGLSFQMIDDILDVTADEDLLGKPSGADLRQKTASLVNILWANSGDTKAKEFFEAREITEAMAHDALLHLRKSEVINDARNIAKDYASRAKLALDKIESDVCSVTKSQLIAIVDYTLERCL